MKVTPAIILLVHTSHARTEYTLVNVRSAIASLSMLADIQRPNITLYAIRLPVAIAITISMRHILGI